MYERSSAASEAFVEVTDSLRRAREVLLVTHARPDGDGLGSMRALALAAGSAEKTVHLFVPDKIPTRLEFLLSGSECVAVGQFEALADRADLIVVLDTCAKEQLDAAAEGIARRRDKVAVIDHHATGDDLGGAAWIDPSAAATGVMVGELIDALGWPLKKEIAEALMAAIVTDTGWLRFANTDGRCLRAVARWTDAGVRPDVLYRRIHQNDRPERLRLLVRVLESMEFYFAGCLAVMTLRQADFVETGAHTNETENMVNEALRIATVESAILLVQNGDCVRVNLRSRDRVNVARLAGRFGGGGHRRAAGLRSTEDIETLKERLVEACGQALSESK